MLVASIKNKESQIDVSRMSHVLWQLVSQSPQQLLLFDREEEASVKELNASANVISLSNQDIQNYYRTLFQIHNDFPILLIPPFHCVLKHCKSLIFKTDMKNIRNDGSCQKAWLFSQQWEFCLIAVFNALKSFFNCF